MAKKSGSPTKNAAVSRYGWMVLLMSFVFIAIVVNIIRIKYVEGPMWRELGRKERVKKDREINPTRGNIYAEDGRLLATSEPLYGVYVDFMADGIEKDTLMKYMRPLSQALAKKFPDRSVAQYEKIFRDGWAQSRKDIANVEKGKKRGSSVRVKTPSRYIRIKIGRAHV